MNKTFTLFLLLAAAAQLVSCEAPHYLYAPSATNNPMFNKKGEANVTGLYTGGVSNNGYNNGYDLQAAYAITNHLAFTLSLSGRSEKDRYYSISSNSYENSPDLFYKRHTTELGIGYFAPLDARGEAYFDFFAGEGFGRYHMTETDLGSIPFDRFHNVSVNKIFFQPGFHFNFSGGQIGLNSRFTIATYNHISTNYTADEQSEYYLDNIYRNCYVFWEPSFTMKLWVPEASWVRLNLQAGFNALISKPYIDYRGIYGTVGLSFDLPKLKYVDRRHQKHYNWMGNN